MARSKAAEKKAKAEYTKRYRKENKAKVREYNRKTVKERASRNKARAMMKKKLGAKAIKGKEIHHVSDRRTKSGLNNSSGNLKVAKKGHGGGTRGSNKNAKGKHKTKTRGW